MRSIERWLRASRRGCRRRNRRSAPSRKTELRLAEVERQPDIVLGDRSPPRFRMQDVVELGVLELRRERVIVLKAVRQHREPPREALGAPDSAQASLGAVID